MAFCLYAWHVKTITKSHLQSLSKLKFCVKSSCHPQGVKSPFTFRPPPTPAGRRRYSRSAICEFYGIKTTEQEIATLAGNPTGTSLHGLAQVADSLGVKATGMELSLEELKGAKTPLIAHLNGGHFVVVVSVHKGQLTVIDPAKGVKSVAAVDFCRNW